MKKQLILTFVLAATSAVFAAEAPAEEGKILVKDTFDDANVFLENFDTRPSSTINDGVLQIPWDGYRPVVKADIAGKDVSVDVDITGKLEEGNKHGFYGIGIDCFLFYRNTGSTQVVLHYPAIGKSYPNDSKMFTVALPEKGKMDHFKVTRVMTDGAYVYTFYVNGKKLCSVSNPKLPVNNKVGFKSYRSSTTADNFVLRELPKK